MVLHCHLFPSFLYNIEIEEFLGFILELVIVVECSVTSESGCPGTQTSGFKCGLLWQRQIGCIKVPTDIIFHFLYICPNNV